MDAHPFHKSRRRDDGEPLVAPPPAAETRLCSGHEGLEGGAGLLPGGPRPAGKGPPSLQTHAMLLVLCTTGPASSR